MAAGVSVRRKAAGGGVAYHTPLLTRADQFPGTTRDIVDEVLHSNPRARCEKFWDFNGAIPVATQDVPLGTIATTGASPGVVVAQYSGRLLGVDIVGSETLATSDTNYITFTVVNRVAGSGTVAMLAVSDANTTKATGGSAFTAKTPKSLTIHGTAANLYVNKGDVIDVLATVTGTLANDVEDVTATLRIATLPEDLAPLAVKIAGTVLVAPVANSDNGEIVCQLGATSEAQIAGVYFGDQLCIEAARAPFIEGRVKISGAAASTRFVWGLASAYNATFDSATLNVWQRVEGNDLTVLTEADDGTTDTDDQAGTVDLVADTYVTFAIDCRDLGKIRYYVNNTKIDEIAASALTGNMQLFCAVQKDSGTGTQSMTLDYLRASWDRTA